MTPNEAKRAVHLAQRDLRTARLATSPAAYRAALGRFRVAQNALAKHHESTGARADYARITHAKAQRA